MSKNSIIVFNCSNCDEQTIDYYKYLIINTFYQEIEIQEHNKLLFIIIPTFTKLFELIQNLNAPASKFSIFYINKNEDPNQFISKWIKIYHL